MNPTIDKPFMKIIRKKSINKVPSEKSDELVKKLRKEHEKLIKGKFEFLDAQGGWLDFCYRFFPGEEVVTYRLIHGSIYELPMGIVKHLNNTVKKIRQFSNSDPTKAQELEGRGIPTSYTIQSRIRFTPIDVM